MLLLFVVSFVLDVVSLVAAAVPSLVDDVSVDMVLLLNWMIDCLLINK